MNPPAASAPLLCEFHRPGTWLAGWAVLFALVALGSLLPQGDLPSGPDGFDKVQHFLGYACLSAYAVMLFARMRPQALAALAVISFGIAIEVAQATLTDDRTGDSADAMANALGTLAGLLLSGTPLSRGLQWLDTRWFRAGGRTQP